MAMQKDIFDELMPRLTSDFDFKSTSGKWLQKGKCPACGKRELFVNATDPWLLKCGRENQCRYERSVREEYPDIFDVWSKRYVQTEKDPHAAADAYLTGARRLNLSGMRGAYSQETYYDGKRRIASATVRFKLPGGTWWERLIDQPGRFDRKAMFERGGEWGGHVWAAPDQGFEAQARAKRIWICEGIFDAWAWRDSGEVAVSAMSVNNWPEKWLTELRRTLAALDLKTAPELIFAFDIGRAGTEYTRKFVARAIEEGWKATAAQPRAEGETEKQDWNDLKSLGRMTPQDVETYLWNGRVLLAKDATEKGLLLWEKHKWTDFHFIHASRTFWAHFDTAQINEVVQKEGVTEKFAAKSCATVTEIANCAFRSLYWQRDEAVDEAYHFMRVDFPALSPYKATFTGAQITSASEFRKRLASVTPIGMWSGSTRQLDRIFAKQAGSLKTVEALDFVGYSREHEAWVLDEIAVSGGKVIRINDEDYFDLGKSALKLRTRERVFDIVYDAERFETPWLRPLWAAFRENGIVTLAFWIMAFFAEQIRREFKSLGFLEMTGIPGTGKSTIIEFLWKLCGRENYEGFDPAKSTLAAYTRNLSRVGNLPVVFMEGDRGEDAPHAKKFDWDEIKPLFNGRIGRARGVKSSGNETYEPPFRGALIIEQNYPVNASPAVMERLMPLNYTKDGWSDATKKAATAIENWPIEELSGAIIHLIRREADYLKTFRDGLRGWEDHLHKAAKVRNGRIRLTHAELHAGLDAMAVILPGLESEIVAQVHAFIDKMAQTKDRSLEADHPIVSDFWDAYDLMVMKDGLGDINLHRNQTDLIAINLLDFESRCRRAAVSCPPVTDLKKHLKASKSRPFVDAKPVNTTNDRIVYCWVFKNPDAVARAKQGT